MLNTADMIFGASTPAAVTNGEQVYLPGTGRTPEP
jgi:hypothetical protein